MDDKAAIDERIRAKIAARRAAAEQARAIVSTAENLEFVVKADIGRRMSEHLCEVQTNLILTLSAIERRKRISRVFVVRAITGLQNKLAVLSAAYQSGALPK